MKNYISSFFLFACIGLLTLAPTCNKKAEKTPEKVSSGKPKIDSIKLVTDKARLCGEVPMTAEQEQKFLETRGLINEELEREVGERDVKNIPEMISYDIKFHIVKAPVSTELKKIDNKMLQDAIKNLNRVFAQVNIRFNHVGTDTLRSSKKLEDLYYNIWNPETDAFFDQYNQANMVNVYLMENSSDGSYLNGFTYPVDLELTAGRNRDLICIANRTLDNGKTLVHEMGHFFTLLHTFHVSNCSGCKTEERADGSNCSTSGDLICDTPADPADINFVDVRTCTYYGNLKDNRGSLYRPIINNFMSYYDACCDYKFTAQQYSLMRKIGEKFRPYLRRKSENTTTTSPTTPATPTNTAPVVVKEQPKNGMTVPVTRPKPAPATAQREVETKTPPKKVAAPTSTKTPAKTTTAPAKTTAKPASTTAKTPAKPATKPVTTQKWTPPSKTTPITKTPPAKPKTATAKQ